MANTKMFVHYSKTKAEFIAAGLATTYNNSIVFIKGDASGNGSCIYTHGTYFANFAELLAAVNYVKGVNVGGQNYNAAAGGGYVAFSATDPSTVAVNAGQNGITIGLTQDFINKVNNTETLASNTSTALGAKGDAANAEGSAFARIAQLAAAVAGLQGSGTGSVADQISAAVNALKGTLDTTDAATLEAINDELNAIDAKWADYVTNATLAAIEGSDNAGDKVKVTVSSKGGKVTEVAVDETGLTNALNLKANAADVYTKGEAESMAQGKVDTLANTTVKANTEAIAKLNGNATVEGSVDKKIQDAINAFAGSADSDNVIENVTELLNYVNGVDGSKTLADAIAQIADNKGKIETLNGNNTTAGSVAKQIKDAVEDEVDRSDKAYAVKGTEGVAASAASRAEEAYTLAGQKATAAEAKAQAVIAISEIAEVTKSDSDNTYVKATVKTKAGSVSSVEIDDSGVKTYADGVGAAAKSHAETKISEAVGAYTATGVTASGLRKEIEERDAAIKAYTEALFAWEEL